MKNYVGAINLFRPKFIRGYAYSIYFFAKWIEGDDIRVHCPSSVLLQRKNYTRICGRNYQIYSAVMSLTNMATMVIVEGKNFFCGKRGLCIWGLGKV